MKTDDELLVMTPYGTVWASRYSLSPTGPASPARSFCTSSSTVPFNPQTIYDIQRILLFWYPHSEYLTATTYLISLTCRRPLNCRIRITFVS